MTSPGMSSGRCPLRQMALARDRSWPGTATCSGEGGMIPPEPGPAQVVLPGDTEQGTGFNPHHLMRPDAVEFFIGQGCKVGLGWALMGQR